MGMESPFCPKFAKVAPLGVWIMRTEAQILPGVPPSAPIHEGRVESRGSPCTRAPKWWPGGTLHPVTKISPRIPPDFPLLKKILARSLLWEILFRSVAPPPPVPVGMCGGVRPLLTLRQKNARYSPYFPIVNKIWNSLRGCAQPVDGYICVLGGGVRGEGG